MAVTAFLFGILPAPIIETNNYKDRAFSYEDTCFMSVMEKGIHRLEDGRLEASLPFREESVELPNNRSHVEKRFYSLRTKLLRDTDFHMTYEQSMNQVVQMGYASGVPDNELESEVGWYISHHAINYRASTKNFELYSTAAPASKEFR